MGCGWQAYMLTTTNLNWVVVHRVCSSFDWDLAYLLAQKGHVHAELLVVTNLPYKHLVAIIYPYSSKTKGKVGIHATPRIGSCCYSYKIVYTVTRWFVWNIIFVCAQTVPAFSNKNCSSQAVTYLLPLKQGHHFYPLLRLLPVTTETRTSFLPSTVTYLLL